MVAVAFALVACGGADTAPPEPGAGATTAPRPQVDLPAGVAEDSFAGEFAGVTATFRDQSGVVQERAEQAGDDPEAIQDVYRALRDTAQQARQDYGALSPPGPVQAEQQRILQLFDRQVELLDDLIAGGDAGDTAAVAAAAQGLAALTTEFDAARQAMQLAIAECGAPCVTG